MIESLVLALALTGQCECPPVYWHNAPVYVIYEPVYVAPSKEYWFGNWSKESEFQADVFYGEKIRTVPVINGFVPEIKNRDGVTIYDYRRQIPYSKCKIPQAAMRAPYIEPVQEAPRVRPFAEPNLLRKPSDVGETQKLVPPAYRSKVSD